MASPRAGKFFRQLEEGLMNLGYGKAKAKLQSVDSSGNVIAYMNMSSASSASGDQQFFIRFITGEVAGLQWPANMKTLLHTNEPIEGAYLVELVVQANDLAAISAAEVAHEKFKLDLMQIIRGQNSAAVRVKLDAHGTNPGSALISSGALVTVAATWDSEGTSLGVLLPYGRSTAGGNLA